MGGFWSLLPQQSLVHQVIIESGIEQVAELRLNEGARHLFFSLSAVLQPRGLTFEPEQKSMTAKKVL